MPPAFPPGTLNPSLSSQTEETGFFAPIDTGIGFIFLEEPALTHRSDFEGLTQDAVDAVVGSALIGIDIAYVQREDEAPFTSVALMHGSWMQEEAPIPCTMDSWLRSVMPETHPQSKTSYAMAQFLQQSQGATSFKRGSATSGSVRSASLAGSPEPGLPSNMTATAKGGRGKSVTPGAGQNENERSVIPASPDIKKQEDRLREELLVRRHQAQAAAQLEAEDTAQKAQITQLAKDLRGKEYSYDHKGQLTILEANGKESKDQELPYRLTLPLPTDSEVQGGGGRGSPTKMRRINPSPTPKGTRASQAAEKERKLASDYKETKPTSQPSALETLRPNAGVMLRQGGQSKAGPLAGNKSLDGVTKDELARMKARQTFVPTPPETTTTLQPLTTKSFAFVTPVPSSTPGITDDAPTSGLVASLADAPSAFFGATFKTPVSGVCHDLKSATTTMAKNVSSIDTINSMLLNAPDWGGSSGVGATTIGSSMQPVKVPPRALQLATIQRDRLPPIALTASKKISKT